MYGNTLQAIHNYKRNKIIQTYKSYNFFLLRADKSRNGTLGIPDWHIKKLWLMINYLNHEFNSC